MPAVPSNYANVSLPPSPNVKVCNRGAWVTFQNTLWALFLRETKTRFGKYRLGLAWAVIDYLIQVVIYGVLFGCLLGSTSGDIPYPVFVAAGYLPFHYFVMIFSASTTALRSNQGLLVYQQVKPMDPFFARLALESLIMVVSMTVFMAGCAWLGITVEFFLPLDMMLYTLAAVLMGAGVGLASGILAYRHAEMERILPHVTRAMYFVSCVLHPLTSVPPAYQKVLLYNPLVSVVEGFRLCLFSGYVTSDISVCYPLVAGVLCLCGGLSYYWRVRDTLYIE